MPVKLAFVGCGSHSTSNLYPALAYADCVLDAVCDRERTLAERNARLFGAASVHTDAERMLDERRPEAVLVVGPPQMHYEVAKLALARGIPTYVEKPTAPDLARTAELVALARANRTILMTGYMKRWGMAYPKAHELIASGELAPAAGFIKYGHWASQDLESMLLYMCVHPIDLALALFGEAASVTSAMTRSARGALSLAVTLRHRSGTLMQLMLDSSQPRIQERLEISGALPGAGGGNALLVVDNVQHLELHRQGQSGVDLIAPSLERIEPTFDLADIQLWRPDYGIPNMGQTRLFFQGFAGAVREFVAAVRDGRDPWPSPEDAVATMRVVDAILRRPDGVTELAASASPAPASRQARA
jgi:myo-inositol 2-dehydrogenase/D-chiro-inositol 1-dehydrogenase